MQRLHFKKMVVGQPSWRTIVDALPDLKYKPGAQRGFVISPNSNKNRIEGRYVYMRFGKNTKLDPESLEEHDEAVEELAECRFRLDMQKGLVSVRDRRGELNALFEALDTIPGSAIHFEELNLNLLDLLFEVQDAYKRNVIARLHIRDYLSREHMLANTNFKILDPTEGEKIAEKFSDQLESFTLTLKLPDGPVSLTVKRKGTVTCSDDAPDELIMFVRDLLPRFHETEVETVEVTG